MEDVKGKANCTCEASRLSADHVCVHTRLVQHHRAQLPQLLPGQDAAHVTRIGPQKLLQSSKSAPWYWVSNDSVGAFVQQLDPTRFRCSHASHSSKCVDIQHVESYLSGISSSPFLAASNSSISSEDTAPVDTDDENGYVVELVEGSTRVVVEGSTNPVAEASASAVAEGSTSRDSGPELLLSYDVGLDLTSGLIVKLLHLAHCEQPSSRWRPLPLLQRWFCSLWCRFMPGVAG